MTNRTEKKNDVSENNTTLMENGIWSLKWLVLWLIY